MWSKCEVDGQPDDFLLLHFYSNAAVPLLPLKKPHRHFSFHPSFNVSDVEVVDTYSSPLLLTCLYVFTASTNTTLANVKEVTVSKAKELNGRGFRRELHSNFLCVCCGYIFIHLIPNRKSR